MGIKWDNIPNELLQKIIEDLGDESKHETKWMMVNRQWFDWYQSKQYKNITIHSLNLSDSMVKNIVYSVFGPGKWVKSIKFDTFVAPPARFSPKFDGDLLYLLMECCLHVRDVQMPLLNQTCEEDWTYFTSALMSTGTWNLHTLTVSSQTFVHHFRNYFICAYHLRESLRELKLTYGMITGSYRCLQNFQNLTTLKIEKDVLKDLHECCRLLEYLPHLVDITVSFLHTQQQSNRRNDNSSTRIVDDNFSIGYKEESITNKIYPSIRKMSLSNYIPSGDEDILLIKKFTQLDYLHLSLPTASEINATMIKSFFRLIHTKIGSYDVAFHVHDEVQFLHEYYDGMKDLERNNGATHSFHLILSVLDYKEDLNENTLISLSKSSDDSTKIYYNIDCRDGMNFQAQDAITRRVLALENNIIQEISLKMIIDDEWSETGDATIEFAIIGITNHRRLRKLNITNGLFNQLTSRTPVPPTRLQTINEIHFNYITIDETMLPTISLHFTYLENISFHACSFLDSEEIPRFTIKISLPSTIVNTLSLSDEDGNRWRGRLLSHASTILFISVVSMEEDIAKCYVCVNDTGAISEMCRNVFDVLQDATDIEMVSIIEVRAKSINTFLFKSRNYDIKITLP